MAEILPLRRKTLSNQSIDVLKKTAKIMIMTGDGHVLVGKEKQNVTIQDFCVCMTYLSLLFQLRP